MKLFQSPRSGKFVSDCDYTLVRLNLYWFQSPRSGKFVSDLKIIRSNQWQLQSGFNPLDRGNLYLIKYKCFFLRE